MTVEDIKNHFEKLQETFTTVSQEISDDILLSCRAIADALKQGHKVLIMGNGGSAADAQHFAAELVGRFLLERKALPAISLTTDSSILTAVGNDYGFDEIFKRQVEALAQPGDVVIGISTSGLSNNVFHALTAANQIGCKTIGLLGRDGGNIAAIVDINLTVPIRYTPYIQGAHGAIIHITCDLVEKELFG
ncbi:MAG: phosphoheptose isomerase [Desulfuromonadales bacterium C00003094]|nr:MAG: phosphoheptose isomerase [Desulfuromonadales bacterium C00003094]